MIYILKGRSKKGKQLIQHHGKIWSVIEKRPGIFGEVLLSSALTGDLLWLTDDFVVRRIIGD